LPRFVVESAPEPFAEEDGGGGEIAPAGSAIADRKESGDVAREVDERGREDAGGRV
jgi:hypothetical protein